MSEKITWTHVDRLVREIHKEEKLLPVGTTDAEIAFNLLRFMRNVRTQAERDYQRAQSRLMAREGELMSLEARVKASEAAKPKNKQRLDVLEAAVAELQKRIGAHDEN